MPFDSIDRWRDEDATPAPWVDRTVEWWREQVAAGTTDEICDVIVVAEADYPPPRLLKALARVGTPPGLARLRPKEILPGPLTGDEPG